MAPGEARWLQWVTRNTHNQKEQRVKPAPNTRVVLNIPQNIMLQAQIVEISLFNLQYLQLKVFAHCSQHPLSRDEELQLCWKIGRFFANIII